MDGLQRKIEEREADPPLVLVQNLCQDAFLFLAVWALEIRKLDNLDGRIRVPPGSRRVPIDIHFRAAEQDGDAGLVLEFFEVVITGLLQLELSDGLLQL